MNIIERIKRFR